MRTENHITICGPIERVFQLAADIAAWPQWLPHYRWVRILQDNGTHKLAAMSALRNRWPCRWVSTQDVYPDEHCIEYRHTGGVSKGMWVEWRLEAHGERVDVTIVHDMERATVPVAGPWFDRVIVGNLFVHHIADRTLACLKRKVEAEAA